MDKVEDKMVEIARFQYVEQAQGLASLLQANGVVCYVRNEYTTQVMGLTDVGGIRGTFGKRCGTGHADYGSQRI